MGSVYVTWQGTCPERATQEELVGFLGELAQHSAARLAGPLPRRPAFLELMTAQREQSAAKVEPVRTFDQELTGQVLLDPCLALAGRGLQEEVQRSWPKLVAISEGKLDKNEAFCLSLGSSPAQWCLCLPRLRVHGIDFRLFDPRGLYPNADRMSFVFLDSPELPSLAGCLAQLESREQCQGYASAAIRAADWYVSAPSIHLRYYLEEWTDLLLSWVKYFFVPDLSYRHYDECAQYEAIRAVIERSCQEQGADLKKRAVFRLLVEKFEAEADEWLEKLGSMT